jgi:3-isopropylmalate dehydrogenase
MDDSISRTPLRILVLGGDGVGPEVIAQALRVLRWFRDRRGLPIDVFERPYGLSAWRECGSILPAGTLADAHAADAVLFGAIGGDYDGVPLDVRRDGSILRLRRELGLYANLRPVRAWPALARSCPLRAEVAAGTDIALVRENTGGLYYGTPRGIESLADGRRSAFNTQRYASDEIERIARFAFELARGRQGRVCSVDKSNVLETGVLWRETVDALHRREYPDLALSHMLVDNCAMQLVRAPSQFDVIVTDNMFGDILSDGAGAVAGSLGMLPSAALGAAGARGLPRALYEPVHGSAPDIEGRGIANPIGAILSVALLLRHTARAPAEADRLERAVERALEGGARCADIAAPGEPVGGTVAMGDAVLAALDTLARAPQPPV